MKNFKKLTLFVAIATVAISSVHATERNWVTRTQKNWVTREEAVKALFNGPMNSGKAAAIGEAINAAQPKTWISMLPTLPSMTLPTFSMPTLGGVQTSLSDAARLVSTKAQSAIRQLPTQKVAYETVVEIAGKKSTKGVAFITAALLLGRIFKSINIAREEALAKGNVAVVKATKPNIVAGFCTKCEYSEHMCNCA